MNLTGTVHEVGPLQQVSETFSKRDLIVVYAENPEYPEYLRFEAIGDKTALFDEVAPGDQVEVHFNLRGRAWTDKTGKTSYFNSMIVWKLNPVEGASQDQENQEAPTPGPGVDDDLPF